MTRLLRNKPVIRSRPVALAMGAFFLSLSLTPVIVAAQSVDCDFTGGNLCGWIVDAQDQLNLQIMQEEQPPPELKTTGAFDSDYIYITMGQMVTRHRGRAKMRIISPYFETATLDDNEQLPTTRCFSFWYRSASWKRSVPASFSFSLQSGSEFFSQDIQTENANVWRLKQIDLLFKKPSDQIRISIDGGDTYFSYVAFDHFHLDTKSCDDAQHVVDKYRMLGGNCPGEYLAQFSEPIGCYTCSLAECLQTCEAFAFCRGVSWVDRKALNEAFPGNSQCYLKAASCWPDIVKFEGGYKFYERISGFSGIPPDRINATSIHDTNRNGNHHFQILSSVRPILPPALAPGPGASLAELGKWLPRNAVKETNEGVVHWEKPTRSPPQFEKASSWLTSGELVSLKLGSEVGDAVTAIKTDKPTGSPSTKDAATHLTTSSRESSTESPESTLSSTKYSLVSSPFPNSKHVYGYVPLQPFGNCGGHFIIDENHQYLGCTRCSFAQCATLCSLSEQCRGFSFTESILVAKQCYLKTALTCEPQPSSTGFKYFIKIKKSNEDSQGAEASNGRNGIGAFTIKPVMPKQTPNSEQESREVYYSTASSTSEDGDYMSATQPTWSQGVAGTGNPDQWSTFSKYVPLAGNCAGAFLRDGSGEAVTCPRCSLSACQKLCDQDDECRGISYSPDSSVAVQCYLKTVDSCSPLSENSGYFFHAKRD